MCFSVPKRILTLEYHSLSVVNSLQVVNYGGGIVSFVMIYFPDDFISQLPIRGLACAEGISSGNNLF